MLKSRAFSAVDEVELQPPPPKSPFSKLTVGTGAARPAAPQPEAHRSGPGGTPPTPAHNVPQTTPLAPARVPPVPKAPPAAPPAPHRATGPGAPPPLPASPMRATGAGANAPMPPPVPARAPSPDVTPDLEPSATPGPHAKVIMVVEDDAAIRAMLVRSLGTSYCVYEASDGQAALEALARIKPPDLVVMDVMMPRMDGWTLASKLKAEQRFKLVPLIFLTGRDSPKDVVQGINAGARHYLTKPFKIQTLLEKVGKAIGDKK